MWVYDKANGDQAISDNEGGIVVYPEDIKQEILEEVVTMWNTGSTLKEVVRYIDDLGDDKDSDMTKDEAEYLIEQIEAWYKLSGDTGTEKETVSAPIVGDQLPGTDAKEAANLQQKAAEAGITKEQSRGEKAAATRKANSTGKVKSATPGTKAIDAKSLVALMKEKIELVEYVAAIEIPEIATPANKDAREIVIALQKAIEQAKNSAIVAIQEL